ncbi:uncharacterized protein MELLADRAFT_111106 [Melampsora larici-populina 98AG31]|uniref:Acyltransferase 3 domain-containing protein n=1 Tax=Melampsora larici-populina (strain 98AG31 / pathotype 3-4-7) TaxID=747676 RepID=F4S221_MELLP|nr:uncharacterized protein MELLADRAFT_111106 [Melampsora larici-populina 98AG31]EGG01288.1 hypothetical protein MELLADRAFT_111106 [Melampsora larici-populina 98AG31]
MTGFGFNTKTPAAYQSVNSEEEPLSTNEYEQEENQVQEIIPCPSKELTQTWANGLRGLAAFCIMIHHSIVAFNSEATLNTKDPDGTVHFWQWPILRAVISPTFLVNVFFVLSGYVLSYRTLYRVGQGHLEAGPVQSSLASASLRRIFRLLPPPVTSIAISHIILLSGGFDLTRAKKVCSWWGPAYTPRWITSNWLEQTLESLKSMAVIWYRTETESQYNNVLWTMPEELRGSMNVFLFLLATSSLKRRFRAMLAVGLGLVNLFMKEMSILPFISGILIAELQVSQSERIPFFEMKSSSWSLWMFRVMSRFYNKDDFQEYRVKTLYYIMGGTLTVLSISQCTTAKRILSTRPLQFLGRISFSLYVIHVPLLLSLGVSLVSNFRDLGVSNTFSIFLMLPFWVGLVIMFSWLMTRFVDEKAIAFSRALERYWSV